MTRHNFDAQATTPRPALTCVCCGQPLDAYWQPALMPTKAGHWLVEDVNKACVMWMQTFTSTNYPPVKLQQYLDNGAKVRAARLARLPEEWKSA